MKLRNVADGREFEIELLAQEGTTARARLDGREIDVEFDRLADGSALVAIGGRRFRVAAARRRDGVMVAVGPAIFELALADENRRAKAHGFVTPEVTAPMPGRVLKVLVGEGDRVAPGQPLVVLEAMKMETTLAAESDAVVKRVVVAAGDTVDHGALLIELGPLSDPAPPAPDPVQS